MSRAARLIGKLGGEKSDSEMPFEAMVEALGSAIDSKEFEAIKKGDDFVIRTPDFYLVLREDNTWDLVE